MTVRHGFRGSSSDAVAELADQVAALADRAKDELAPVADELFSVAGVLREEGSLRRFATDNSVAVEARTGLVTEVFSGKVSQSVVDLVTAAVKHRWSRTRDLADAMEYLGVIAAVRSTGEDSKRLVEELFTVRSAVTGNPDLRAAVSDPGRAAADRATLFTSLLSAEALPATLLLAKQSLAGGHRSPVVALTEYEEVAADVHDESVATVRSARPLSDAEAGRLAAALQAKYGRAIHLHVVHTPDLVGGLRVEIADDVIDGTVSGRLADAQRLLAG